jgi:CheY-like chemotaxis protein
VLPKRTGEKLYWDLRRDPQFSDLPVVVVSGYARIDSPKIDFHGFVAEKNIPPPDGFLEKPVDVEKLLETVTNLLAGKSKARQ